VVAVAVTMTAALLVGLPLLRLRGHYLALATLGFGIIVAVLATESDFLGATSGIFGIDKPSMNGRVYDSASEYFLLLTPIVLVGLLLARNIVQSRIGRALGAVNDSRSPPSRSAWTPSGSGCRCSCSRRPTPRSRAPPSRTGSPW
jgi:branched-chain amino acid transport system permease protein